jgi:plasmid stability protein
VHRALKARAKIHGRSLNKEIMATLACSLHSVKIDATTVTGRARAIREEMGVYLTQAELSELKDTGRR